MEERHTESGSSEGRSTQRLYPEVATRPSEAPPRKDQTRVLAFVLIGLGMAMLFSNVARLPFGQDRERTYGVEAPMDGASAARVSFEWGSGHLLINTADGPDEVVWGSAEATRALVVDTGDNEDDGERIADVSVSPRSEGWFGGFSSASGDLMLNERLPYDVLAFDLESGSANLDLSQLDVRELNLDAGSGSVILQLPAQGAVEGSFDLGSGSLDMTLPPNMEARIVVDQGSGSFSAGSRLKPVEGDDDVYETPGYNDEAEQRIELEVEGGNGSITIN